jgi:hypothetical protein
LLAVLWWPDHSESFVKSLLLVGLAVVALAGCATAGAVEPSASPSPSSSPEPTPTPTPETTPTPTPEATPISQRWPEFIANISNAVEVAGTHMTTMKRNLDQQDIGAALLDLEQWEEFVKGEIDWLKGNPPDACYAEMHAGWIEVFTDYRKAYVLMVPFLQSFPFGEQEDFDTSKGIMDGTVPKIDALDKILKSSQMACGF